MKGKAVIDLDRLEAEHSHQMEHIWYRFYTNVTMPFRWIAVEKYRLAAPLILLIVPASLLFGCIGDRKPEWNMLTPEGYRVNAPGSWSHGMEMPEVLSWVDARIDQWVSDRSVAYGVSEDSLRGVASNTVYNLVDDWCFVCVWSPTFYAEGMCDEGDPNEITACLYTKAESAEYPDAAPYPEWVQFRQGVWKYGVFPADGVGFAVLLHELDHAAGIISHDG